MRAHCVFSAVAGRWVAQFLLSIKGSKANQCGFLIRRPSKWAARFVIGRDGRAWSSLHHLLTRARGLPNNAMRNARKPDGFDRCWTERQANEPSSVVESNR